MEYFKGHSTPGVPDLQGRLQVLRSKEEVARAEVETFMEHCAKRWQTKEGTYWSLIRASDGSHERNVAACSC